MRGKYSPTVSEAYIQDQNWHARLRGDNPVYDVDGYDSYGYNKDDVDRAGNHESAYYADDIVCSVWGPCNFAYDTASAAWGFDGVRPVVRG